jgi:glycine/D-amino acid oxidase-like deaminating enzyme
MAREQDPLTTSTLATLERVGVPHQRLSRAQLESRWPQIDFGPITWAIHEPGSGVLMARRAVEAVVREAEREGVRYLAAAVNTVHPPAGGGALDALATRSGERIGGAVFIFACGPWLPKLFPDLLGDRIFATRQEVLYFGPPAGDSRFATPAMPAWIDFGEEIYGIPDIAARGFKIALDRHGPPFDPDTGDRVAGQTFDAVRAYMTRRFPALRDAPLVAAEVCQYENTCNGDFLIDRHPELENVWLIGGGSGHGFKHGPALGEYVARLVADGGVIDERFRLTTKEKVQQRMVF